MSINLSCHSEEHPKGTCFAARSDVGIRNLLVANSHKSVKIVRFWNRLPRQSADWLAMTGFFDSLKRTSLRRFFQLVDKPSLWGQRFFYAGGARGGKARLESDQISECRYSAKSASMLPSGALTCSRRPLQNFSRLLTNSCSPPIILQK